MSIRRSIPTTPLAAAILTLGLAGSTLGQMASASQIEAMTGGRTRIIWAAAISSVPSDGNHFYDQLDPLYKLRGFDTREGAVKAILQGPEWCQRPRLTPDGNRVVYSTRPSTWGARQAWIINWDGTGKRQLCGGGAGAPFNGEVLDTWKDPGSGKMYAVIAGEKSGAYVDVWIVNVDDVTDRRLTYTHSAGIQTVEISDDGMRLGIAGSQKVGMVSFTSPAGGQATYTPMWTANGNACNAGTSGGASSILMHLHDDHKSVVVYPTMTAGAGIQVSMAAAPGLNNGTIWMPRWSVNDPRIFTLTSPLTNSSWAFTGTSCRIVMGKFGADYKSVESWLTVSTGSNYDVHGSVWIGKSVFNEVGISSFAASPQTIAPGATSTLSWSVANATAVTMDGNIGTVPATGTRTVSPTATTTYTLTASNSSGSKTASVTVAVASNVSIASFVAAPTAIAEGDSATLSWDVVNGDSVKIDQSIGKVASKGSTKIRPAVTTTYTLTAFGPGGPVTGQTKVTVTSGYLAAKFTFLSPKTGDIWTGGRTYSIQWTGENATEAVIKYSFDRGLNWTNIEGVEAVRPNDPQWGSTRWVVKDTAGTCMLAISTYNLSGWIESGEFTVRRSTSAVGSVPDAAPKRSPLPSRGIVLAGSRGANRSGRDIDLFDIRGRSVLSAISPGLFIMAPANRRAR